MMWLPLTMRTVLPPVRAQPVGQNLAHPGAGGIDDARAP